MSPLGAALVARNAVATAIVSALDDARDLELLDALADVFTRGSAPLAPSLARRLATTGGVVLGIECESAIVVTIGDALAEHRSGSLHRLARGRGAAEQYWQGTAAERATPDPTTRAAPAAHDPIATALAQAAALWSAELFFEVHEILERAWRDASGERRRFLQGLIQIAVAFHHLDAGNVPGAINLFGAGRTKLAPFAPHAYGVEIARLLREVEPWEAAAARGARSPEGRCIPRLNVRAR